MSVEAATILPVLQQVLVHLRANPYPHVPGPASCKKRASVAIVIRVRPAFSPVPASESRPIEHEEHEPPVGSLIDFFKQQWVQQGDPEILFIKRAGRVGDRWAGHVALPGGKRDPEDDDDAAAAIRETREEVGLDISSSDCLPAGNLPERVVSAAGGQALMVLCPYIFLLTCKDVPRVQPQPTEVAAAHWVPIRALLSPNLRTREYVDFASRLVAPGGRIAQMVVRLLVGRMVFSAVQLLPSESVYASSIDGFLPPHPESTLAEVLLGALPLPMELTKQRLTFQQPLLLWGLTLGVLADFLDMLPPYNAVQLWRYPTFTPLDLRILLWLLTRRLRRDNAGDLSGGTWPYKANRTAIDATTEARAVSGASTSQPADAWRAYQNEVGIGGLGVGTSPQHAVGKLLQGYYHRVNVAIAIFAAYRCVMGAGMLYWLFRLWHKLKRSSTTRG